MFDLGRSRFFTSLEPPNLPGGDRVTDYYIIALVIEAPNYFAGTASHDFQDATIARLLRQRLEGLHRVLLIHHESNLSGVRIVLSDRPLPYGSGSYLGGTTDGPE